MTRPRVEELRPCRSERARSLRWKPSSEIAAATRSAVALATPGSSLMTRETVFRLTPAASATSRIVGRVVRRAISVLSPPSQTTLSDNVVRAAPYARRPGVSRPLVAGSANRGWVGRLVSRTRLSSYVPLRETTRQRAGGRAATRQPSASLTSGCWPDLRQQPIHDRAVQVTRERRLHARGGGRDAPRGRLDDRKPGLEAGSQPGGEHVA